VGDGAPFKIGDRVMARASYREGWGGLAEYCLADANNAALIPSTLSDVEAAGFITSYKTAYDAYSGAR
jgi:NADPH:quinone reductase